MTNTDPNWSLGDSQLSNRAIIGMIFLGVSIAAMIYKAETDYDHMESVSKWARSFGYGFSPWILGLLVAVLKEGWARLRKKAHSFGVSLLWGTGLGAILLVISAFATASEAENTQQVRDDAMLLMGAAVGPPSFAAYCNKYVAPNEGILAAAAAWNKRHKADLGTVLEAVKKTGGLSKDGKRLINQLAMRALESEFAGQSDKVAYCERIEAALKQGIFDLRQREDTALALNRVYEFLQK